MYCGIMARLAKLYYAALMLHTQRAQYPLMKEYGLNYIGLHIMIQTIFLNYGVLGSLGKSRNNNKTLSASRPEG